MRFKDVFSGLGGLPKVFGLPILVKKLIEKGDNSLFSFYLGAISA
jgi:hypothetical protein